MASGLRTRSGRRDATRRRRLWPFVVVPIAVSLVSQLSSLQNASCVLAELPWGVGRCDVLADLVAPVWALSILVASRRLRTVALRDASPSPAGHGERRAAIVATRVASSGAVAIILLAWTREWERFGENPDASWYTVVVVITFGALLVPVWSMRDALHRRGTRFLDTHPAARRVDRALFEDGPDRPARWPHLLVLSGVTLVVSFIVLGQFDALLQGMHLPGDPPAGIAALTALTEVDLSEKLGLTLERVGSWRAYTEAVGSGFGSPYAIVVAHTTFDTLISIPAYFVGGVVLALVAWRRRLRFAPDSDVRRSFELVVLTGLVVLVATATFDLVKTLLTWFVTDRAWDAPAELTDAAVRLLWFSTVGRTLGLLILAVAVVLLLAIADISVAPLRRALVAVRAEVLLLGLFAFGLFALPQTADVIRGWQVSHTLITVGLAIVWSMLVRWTSVQNLRLQQRHWEAREAGADVSPPTIALRGRRRPVERMIAIVVLCAAAGQLLLHALGLPIGTGLLVPAGIVGTFALFGLALPAAPYLRGDRPVSATLRRRIPRTLGSLVYFIIGITVIKAAAGSVAYARNEDWWLFFALVPPAIGIWRAVTRSTSSPGHLEIAFSGVVAVLGMVLLARGDPELSPSALGFAGVTFTYGSVAFFHSYEPRSIVKRMGDRILGPGWVKPFAIVSGVVLAVTILLFYGGPLAVAPQVGTIGLVVLAMMALTLVGAGAARLAETTPPPRILAAFGIRRTPLVTLLVVWFVLAPPMLDAEVSDVRRVAEPGRRIQVTFDDVWNRWSGANTPPLAASDERQVVPMLLVSSSGGGLRAAAWTSFVLGCLFEADPLPDDPCGAPRPIADLERVALMSGVSGGALGISLYAARAADAADATGAGNEWVDDVLGDDFLAASVGWLFFVDLPRSLFGFGPGLPDRAAIMEQAWETAWPDGVLGLRRGIAELWLEAPSVPALVFNGTSVRDGCRVNVSVLDVSGGSPEIPACSAGGGFLAANGPFGATHDLVDYLCPGEDIALSTAAGMSARYPYVSPAGRLAASDPRCAPAGAGAVYVVDGAYLEGSGAGSLLDGWVALSNFVARANASRDDVCVVPFMVHIDNGYESATVTSADSPPREMVVPIMATLSVASGITAARAEAAIAFEAPFRIAGDEVRLVVSGSREAVESRYARIVTRAHPGVQAPLGWTLSQASIDDLRNQLSTPENREAFAEVRRWLAADLTCETG